MESKNQNQDEVDEKDSVENKKDKIIDDSNEEQEEIKEEELTDEEKAEKEHNDLLKNFNDLNDRYMRMSAEFDNYRKRTLKEKMDLIQSGGSDVLKSILPVLDNVERAIKSMNESSDLEAVKDGVELIYKHFSEFLMQRGVTEIKTIGEVFDTDMHEAIAQMPAEKKKQKGKIIDVIEKGYKLNDKILRFAKVVVAK